MSSPPEAPSLWRVALSVPCPLASLIEARLEGAAALSIVIESPERRRVEALIGGLPNAQAIAGALKALCREHGVPAPGLTLEEVPALDWVAHVREDSPPVIAGRYFVHGTHLRPRAGTIALAIDAGLAFGTGRHPSTRGCLLALERLAKRMRPRRVLDLGCGSGVLAIAAAKTWRVPVIACDIDPVAVRCTRANARANGVPHLVRALSDEGLRAPRLLKAAPFSLVLANISARPLAALAPALARSLEPGGYAVLSGLLKEQAPGLVSAYRRQGLALESALALEGWTTLVMAKRHQVEAP
ncbi:MAG TPA: 50S ribosomal protein L11 methyltransferase [Alphaproteobacteria bacterium]|nr:50S ribosomal protein L11 methyltransferase [Alphaproteobacteria bacterium]